MIRLIGFDSDFVAETDRVLRPHQRRAAARRRARRNGRVAARDCPRGARHDDARGAVRCAQDARDGAVEPRRARGRGSRARRRGPAGRDARVAAELCVRAVAPRVAICLRPRDRLGSCLRVWHLSQVQFCLFVCARRGSRVGAGGGWRACLTRCPRRPAVCAAHVHHDDPV